MVCRRPSGPIALSSVVERTGTSLDDLDSRYLRERVEQTIHADSLDDARDLVAMLEEDTTPSPRPTPTATDRHRAPSVPSGTATP